MFSKLAHFSNFKNSEISKKNSAGYSGLFTHHYTSNYIIWPKEIEIE